MKKQSNNPLKKLLSVFAVIISVAAGFALFSHISCNKAHAASCPTEIGTEKTAGNIQLAPNYFQYTEETLAQAQQSGRTVLYFWAPWCSTCSSLDIELQEGKTSIPNGITLLRVHYDQASELKQKYNVTTQHTFVQIDQNGDLLTAWVGGDIVDFSRYIK